jgi:hypothetical protein
MESPDHDPAPMLATLVMYTIAGIFIIVILLLLVSLLR